MAYIRRALELPEPGGETFFLWGPRQSGKTTLLREPLKGLRELAAEHPGLGRKIVVCREPKSRRTSDGIDILPVADFVATLWSGGLF